MSTEHPNGVRLEELAAGGHDAEAEAHLTTCAECTKYVERLRAGAEEFAKKADVPAFMKKLEERAAQETTSPETTSPETNVVRPLMWARVAWIAAPLAAAAIFMLVARPPAPSPTLDDTSGGRSALHFKGATQIAAIVERDGHQERVTGEAHVRPGDRIRVEVGLDQGAPTVAGILEKDGTWTPLLPATMLEAGTHYSDEAAHLDENGADGWILVGRPEAVERARQTHDFGGVAVLPLLPMR